MRHGDRRQLVRDDNGLKIVRIFGRGFCQSFYDRAMISSGVGEEIADRPKRAHVRQERLGPGGYRQ
jgi:hypothetical protein